MTTQLTVRDLERLLRAAAPDEPAILPPLSLPVGRATASPGVHLRRRATPAQPERLRLLVAITALLALLAAALAAGALRDADKPELLAERCMTAYIPGEPVDPECLPVAVPDGWTVLGSGQLQPGNFTEVGIGYELVELVMASVPLSGCATPGGPMPTGIPVGPNEEEIPAATPDPGLACIRSATLPENGIRVVTMRGTRITGVAEGGEGIVDTSEPTEAAGWTEQVAGRPARLSVATSGSDPVVETRTWDILYPGSIDSVLRIRADIAGPDLEAGRAAVAGILETVRFDRESPRIDEGARLDVLRTVLDELDRDARQVRSDFYACFPRDPGSSTGTISGGPSAPLGGPLEVTCSSDISLSRAGVWRIVLEVAWPAGDGYPADTVRTEYFTTGIPGQFSIEINGGYTTAASGRQVPFGGIEELFPTSAYQLPPPLDGPLDLQPGSLVRMLWPGEAPVPEAGASDGSDGYPSKVGSHLYVLAGPEIVDGEEWYRIQWETDGHEQIGWLRGTRDGRPQLEVIEPSCPTGDLTVGAVTWLIPAERLLCLGGRDITFAEAVIQPGEGWPFGPMECFDEDGPCPTGAGSPDWLTVPATWALYGADGPDGPEPYLAVWLHPSVQAPQPGVSMRVTGHFDDPGAIGCEFGPIGTSMLDPIHMEHSELLCRERFVVTAIEPR